MSALPARYVALSGGVGGAKLSLGLASLLSPRMTPTAHHPSTRHSRDAVEATGDPRLTIIANTGDDFEHLGLHVSPDVDTTLYTLADVVNPETGWGRRDETWSFMDATADLGGPTWFKLGDRDLATHIERTRRLKAGETMTAITAHLSCRFGIAARILPMSDAPMRTLVDTDTGTLAFQDYFVREQCSPVVRHLRYDGADAARPTPQVLQALSDPALVGIIICPSNPWLSIDPILAIPGMRQAIRASGAPVIAVTPIIGGKAVKGPTAKIMAELGIAPDALSIAKHYDGLIDGFVLDAQDEALISQIPAATTVANTLMRSLDDKVALARICLAFCKRLVKEARSSTSRELERAAT
jgi:LPPG:FO 2-phospho-L-lactate transferase